MIRNIVRVTLFVVGAFLFSGCPPTMEVFYEDLSFANNSNQSVELFLNLHYPDSSFEKVIGDKYVESGSEMFVGAFYQLKALPGLTIFVFDHSYVRSQWSEGAGQPHEYLSQDSILAKYTVTKTQLDSLGWRIVYP